VTSWVTLGAMFGSLGGGFVADLFGRKRTLFAAAALFIMGALVQSFAPNVPILVFGRLVAGFGVGVAAVAAPLYAAELAPAAQRGRFVSSYQLAITVGIFVAYLVNQALAGPEGWRTMLGVAAVPAPSSPSPCWSLSSPPAGSPRLDDARTLSARSSLLVRSMTPRRDSRRSRSRCALRLKPRPGQRYLRRVGERR
jgi:MFS family permease